MHNSGDARSAAHVADHFVRSFADPLLDYIVAPSGSCVAMVRHQYPELLDVDRGIATDAAMVIAKTYELCEFLFDRLGVRSVAGSFPHRVGLHASCHGLRELRLANGSERMVQGVDKVRALLQSLEGISFANLERADECCGFGGTFAIDEEAISCAMGNDRIDDHIRGGAEIIAATDMSCLMHMDGLLRRRASPVKVMHIAQILAAASQA